MRDPQIGASPDLRLTLVQGSLLPHERALAPLFCGGPARSRARSRPPSTIPTGERNSSLLVQFVRVDKVVPAIVRPFSDLEKAAAGNEWSLVGDPEGQCVDVSVLGLARPLRRTVLPPHAARSFVAWRGGFAAVGNSLLVYQNGGWLAAGAPLASVMGAVRDREVFATGTRLYLRMTDGLDVVDTVTGKRKGSIALDQRARVLAVRSERVGGGDLGHIVGRRRASCWAWMGAVARRRWELPAHQSGSRATSPSCRAGPGRPLLDDRQRAAGKRGRRMDRDLQPRRAPARPGHANARSEAPPADRMA